ncbi:MAG: CPBP family intramembrane metalloprotease [bacterium]|nr:CPBP family intramembrane metalloprotease [bacterium]MDE0288095.1 CPBP family intramembrane metalloprotease [bacterium]MDE0439486.1 CPBP family intramembrane metalloprotease [bacterium]
MGRTSWRWYDVPIVMAGGAFASLVAGAVAGAVFGTAAEDAHLVFWLIIPFQNLGLIGSLVLVARMRGHRDLGTALGLVVEPRQAWWVAAGAASLVPLSLLAAALRSALGVEDESPQAIVEAALEVSGTVTMVAVAIGVGVLGPVAEELLYRGLTFRIAARRGAPSWIAVVVSAAVFTAAHLADPTLFSPAGAVTLSALFTFGVFLGVLRVRTGGLGAPIFAHSGFNLMTLTLMYFLA